MVSLPLVGLVGRAFWRMVKWFPPAFLLLCGGGLITGIAVLLGYGSSPTSTKDKIFMWCGGIGIILFYGWLGVLCLRKLQRGEWQDFCDERYDQLANF